MNEDVMKILKMVEAGTITAEDGMKLIEAVSSDRKKPSGKVKYVRLEVHENTGGKPVEIKLPVGILKAGLKIGEKFSPGLQETLKESEYEQILSAINEGASGQVITVNAQDGHRVIITLE